MYAGIMNDSLSNIGSVNGQLDQLNKKKLLGNNVQQYQNALSGEQDKYMQTMQRENPTQYEVMMKAKYEQMQLDNSNRNPLQKIKDSLFGVDNETLVNNQKAMNDYVVSMGKGR